MRRSWCWWSKDCGTEEQYKSTNMQVSLNNKAVCKQEWFLDRNVKFYLQKMLLQRCRTWCFYWTPKLLKAYTHLQGEYDQGEMAKKEMCARSPPPSWLLVYLYRLRGFWVACSSAPPCGRVGGQRSDRPPKLGQHNCCCLLDTRDYWGLFCTIRDY